MTKTAVPATPAEFEEWLADTDKVTAAMKDGSFAGHITDYVRLVARKDPDIPRQIKEETERALIAFLKDNESDLVKRLNLSALPQPGASGTGKTAAIRNAQYNPLALGAKLDGEFIGGADFLSSIWHNQRDSKKLEKIMRIQNAFSSVVPSDGGFLVPESFRAELMMLALETAVVRPRAMVVPMDTARVIYPAIDATSNVSSVFGGIVTYWTEEGATLTESSAKFSDVVLDAKNLTAYTEVPNQLIADAATAFEALIMTMFPRALAFGEDAAFFNGTGAGEPLGFMRSPAAIAVAAESLQPSATIVWENIVKMFARMLPSSLSTAVWVADIACFPELATMALSVGTGGAPVWLNNGQEGPPMTILGRPVIFTEKANTLGTQGDINFIDLSYYLVGDRQQMTAMSSPHYKFANVKTAYRFTQRVDGRPWIQSAITPKNNGNTLSPIVQLATR